jgi:hypothetical protein
MLYCICKILIRWLEFMAIVMWSGCISDSKAIASGDSIYARKPDAGTTIHFVMQIYLHSSLIKLFDGYTYVFTMQVGVWVSAALLVLCQ